MTGCLVQCDLLCNAVWLDTRPRSGGGAFSPSPAAPPDAVRRHPQSRARSTRCTLIGGRLRPAIDPLARGRGGQQVIYPHARCLCPCAAPAARHDALHVRLALGGHRLRSSEDVHCLVQAEPCGPELALAQLPEDIRCVAFQQ